MNATPKSTSRRSRGLILTKEALEILDQGLRKWWETSEARRASKTGKLTRDKKAEGLGLEEKTVDKIYRYQPVDEATLRNAFAALKITPPFSQERYCVSAQAISGNLSHVSPHLIGRELQITEIMALLESHRLVTLTGAGGVGKTQLALQVAREMKRQFAAGIWFVELAGVTEPTTVPQQVATTLGVSEETHSPLMQTLVDFLRAKPLLLILDNCEHLLEACATLVDHLLVSASGLKVLATSRERLNITSERPFRVPSLAVPDIKKLLRAEDLVSILRDCDSARLFVEQARIHHPDFRVTNRNARELASICLRLDGIPLAIELAAARMRAMSLDELECRLDDCFRLLTGGSRTALPRHQTLRATMDWSYSLLTEKEKTLLGRLSVFASGCRLEAAEQVCSGNGIEEGKALDLLTSLVDKNLVVYEEQRGKARYYLLETVRQYGREQLAERGDQAAVERRHRDFYLTLAEEATQKLTGAEQLQWLQCLDEEYENLRAGLNWSLSAMESSAMLRFCGALSRFWRIRAYLSEGRAWCARALKLAGAQEPAAEWAKAFETAGVLACHQGDYAFARACYEQNIALFGQMGDRGAVARSLKGLGGVAYSQGDYTFARACYEQSLVLYHEIEDLDGMARTLNELGAAVSVQGEQAYARSCYEQGLLLFQRNRNQSGIASALKNLGGVLHTLGDYTSARPYLEQGLVIRQEIGDWGGMAYSLCDLGQVAYAQGDFAFARSCHEQSLLLFQQLGEQAGIAYALKNLGSVFHAQGDAVSARSYLEQSLSLLREIGRQREIVFCLEAFAELASRENKAERAVVLWGAVETFRQQYSLPRSLSAQATSERHVEQIGQTLGEETFLAAWTLGRSLTLEQAMEYALEASRVQNVTHQLT